MVPGASTPVSKDARIPAESSGLERPFAQKGFTTEILYVLLIPGVNDLCLCNKTPAQRAGRQAEADSMHAVSLKHRIIQDLFVRKA